MMINHSSSDQLHTWSDNAEQIDIFVTPPSQDITAPTAASRASIARLTHRTLQALRQTWLQMCKRSGSWTQALSLHQSHRRASSDGLRSSSVQRTGSPIPGQLPTHPCDPRRVGCHQSRTVASPRDLLSYEGERLNPRAHQDSRPFTGGYPHCQYARNMARSGAFRLCLQGGKP